MPAVIVPVNNTDATVTRLVAKSVIEQLLYIYHLQVTDIRYTERGNKSVNSQENVPGQALSLDSDDYIIVSYKEKDQPDVINILPRHVEHIPIMAAPVEGISVTPVHNFSVLEFSITIRFKSFDKAQLFRDRFKYRQVDNNSVCHHDIQYNYTVPNPILDYLYIAHSAMETLAPYNRSLKQFVEATFTPGVIIRGNLDDSNRSVAINVINRNCLGRFTSQPLEIETNKDELYHEIQGTYELDFEKITHLYLTYKEIIHNQQVNIVCLYPYMNRGYIGNVMAGKRPFTGIMFWVSDKLYADGLAYDAGVKNNTADISLYDDDFIKDDKVVDLFIIPIRVDPTHLNDVINLDDIADPNVTVRITDILKVYWEYLSTGVNCKFPIRVNLYRGNPSGGGVPIDIDSNLNVTTVNPMNLRYNYYLKISILKNWRTLCLGITKTLRGDPPTSETILKILDSNVKITTIGDGTWIPETIWDEAVDKVIVTTGGDAGGSNLSSLMGEEDKYYKNGLRLVMRQQLITRRQLP